MRILSNDNGVDYDVKNKNEFCASIVNINYDDITFVLFAMIHDSSFSSNKASNLPQINDDIETKQVIQFNQIYLYSKIHIARSVRLNQ